MNSIQCLDVEQRRRVLQTQCFFGNGDQLVSRVWQVVLICSLMFVCSGNINGAVSSNVVRKDSFRLKTEKQIDLYNLFNKYRARDAPRYRLGHGIVLMYIGIGFISTISYILYLRSENARRDRGGRDEIIESELVSNEKEPNSPVVGHGKGGRFATVEDAKTEKGDEWSGYRYTI